MNASDNTLLELVDVLSDQITNLEKKMPEYEITACYFPGTGEVELSYQQLFGHHDRVHLTLPIQKEDGDKLVEVIGPCVYYKASTPPMNVLRMNYEFTDDGVGICNGTHDKSEPCEYDHYTHEDAINHLRSIVTKQSLLLRQAVLARPCPTCDNSGCDNCKYRPSSIYSVKKAICEAGL